MVATEIFLSYDSGSRFCRGEASALCRGPLRLAAKSGAPMSSARHLSALLPARAAARQDRAHERNCHDWAPRWAALAPGSRFILIHSCTQLKQGQRHLDGLPHPAAHSFLFVQELKWWRLQKITLCRDAAAQHIACSWLRVDSSCFIQRSSRLLPALSCAQLGASGSAMKSIFIKSSRLGVPGRSSLSNRARTCRVSATNAKRAGLVHTTKRRVLRAAKAVVAGPKFARHFVV